SLCSDSGNDADDFVDGLGDMRLPAEPRGLGPGWTIDPSHQDPNGVRLRHPSGDYLDFHKGRPGERGWKGRDHWHHNGDRKHFKPGDEVSDPPQACGEPKPDDLDEADDIIDSDDADDVA